MFIDSGVRRGSNSVRSSMCRRFQCDTFLPEIHHSLRSRHVQDSQLSSGQSVSG